MIAQKQTIPPKPETDCLICLLKELGVEREMKNMQRQEEVEWITAMVPQWTHVVQQVPNIRSSYFDNCFQFIFWGLCSSPVSVIKGPEGKVLPQLQMWQVIQDWPIKASYFPGSSNLFPVIPWPRWGQSKPVTQI